MVYYQWQWLQIRRGDKNGSSAGDRVLTMEKGRRQFLRFLLCLTLSFCSLLGSHLFFRWSSAALFPLSSFSATELESALPSAGGERAKASEQTSFTCDRRSIHYDVCVLRGDVRTNSPSSIYLYKDGGASRGTGAVQVEKIRPYTRKWEPNLMNTIEELELGVLDGSSGVAHHCDILYRVPAVVFSASGYTGNVYHDFNDVIIPLYITSQRFQRQVVFVVLGYRSWWISKYQSILSRLSAFPVLDFFAGNLTLCFPEVTVGLQMHADLAVDPSLTTPANQSIHDFRRLLDDAYRPHEEKRAAPPALLAQQEGPSRSAPPKMVILFRDGSRAVENENEVVKLCEEIGFQVKVLRPTMSMELAEIYGAVSSSDAMLGVVGCALTHLLFMKPNAVLIQIVLLGTDWAAEASYGVPAKKMGLKYIPYKIKPSESSLSRIYPKDDPVLTDPEAVSRKSWEVTKRLYLDQQKVRLDLNRLAKSLTRAYEYTVALKKTENIPELGSGT